MKKHYHWADWARVIGIWLVIVGHFFPGMTKSFIYSFHVPFFFVISGFLSGKTVLGKEFVIKTWDGLIKPYFYICLMVYLIHLLLFLCGIQFFNTSIEELNPICFLLNILLGRHGGVGMSGFGNAMGCSTMWFVYSLILVKTLDSALNTLSTVFKLTNITKWGVIVCVIIAYLQIFSEFHKFSAFNTLPLVFPFFYFGRCYAACKEKIHHKIINIKWFQLTANILILMILQYIISYYNEPANIVESEFGKNILIFYLLGFSGSILTILAGEWMAKIIKHRWVALLSSGTILILGLHMLLVKLSNELLIKPFSLNREIVSYPLAIIILVLFIPIVKVLKPLIEQKNSNNIYKKQIK